MFVYVKFFNFDKKLTLILFDVGIVIIIFYLLLLYMFFFSLINMVEIML